VNCSLPEVDRGRKDAMGKKKKMERFPWCQTRFEDMQSCRRSYEGQEVRGRDSYKAGKNPKF